jgi:hypothetical protein
MGDLKGYPVRSSFTLAVGGPQCKSPATGGGASEGGGGGSPFGGLAGQLGGQLGGLLGGRRKSEPAASGTAASPPAGGAAATTAAGLATLFTMRSELVSIRTDAAPAATFEIPAGFKKDE